MRATFNKCRLRPNIIVDEFFGEYEEPACHLILDVILKEGFDYGNTVANIQLMGAAQDVLLRRLGLWKD